jgi:hypothetical protein
MVVPQLEFLIDPDWKIRAQVIKLRINSRLSGIYQFLMSVMMRYSMH